MIWRCDKCHFTYDSPIKVYGVQHKCSDGRSRALKPDRPSSRLQTPS